MTYFLCLNEIQIITSIEKNLLLKVFFHRIHRIERIFFTFCSNSTKNLFTFCSNSTQNLGNFLAIFSGDTLTRVA